MNEIIGKIKFDEGNRQFYMQDHSFCNGVPHDIEFEVRRLNTYEKIELRADGYGIISTAIPYDHKSYGNGAIFMLTRDLTTEQKTQLNILKETDVAHDYESVNPIFYAVEV